MAILQEVVDRDVAHRDLLVVTRGFRKRVFVAVSVLRGMMVSLEVDRVVEVVEVENKVVDVLKFSGCSDLVSRSVETLCGRLEKFR